MAWIKTISDSEAQGTLAALYEAARRRAGRVFNIVRAQGLNPRVLKAGMGLYQAAMFGPSELTRAQRELLGVVVSKANGCHY
jgi:alkylhydroperoxidase family enzyme